MRKGTPRKRKRDKPPYKTPPGRTPRPKKQPSRFLSIRLLAKRIVRRAWAVFAGLAIVAGIAVIVYPRVSVEPSASLNPSSPFDTPFVLSNNGYLPIYAIDFSCHPSSMDSASSPIHVEFEGVEIRNSRPLIPAIASGEKATTRCTMIFGYEDATTDKADVSIVVRFKPFGIPWQQEKRFRFVAVRGADGIPHWLPKALSE